jgi:hypothetical protein
MMASQSSLYKRHRQNVKRHPRKLATGRIIKKNKGIDYLRALDMRPYFLS